MLRNGTFKVLGILVILAVFCTGQAAAAPRQASALDVVISEVAWAGTAANVNGEWIELYNPTSSAINLAGWTLVASDNIPTINLTGIIPAGGYYLLERTADTTISDIAADQIYTGALSNTTEILTLRDSSSKEIDTANSGCSNWCAGPLGTGTPPYASMERKMPVIADGAEAWFSNNGVTRNGLDANGNPINGTPHNSQVDLSLSMTVDDASPNIGDNITFTLTINNAGLSPSTNTSVKDVLPTGLTYVSDNGGGAYDSGTGIWTVATLSPAAGAALEITARVTAKGVLTNSAEVWTSDQPDRDSIPGNGSTTEDDDASADLTAWLAVLYAKPVATGGGDCSSWDDACALQAALADAFSGAEIWVMGGIYTPGVLRADTFQLKSGVAVYGGFAGTEAARSQRDSAFTILSGDLNGDDVGFTNNSENAYHVVTGANGATLDGFTIQAGNADGAASNDSGGGMYNTSGSPALTNVTFSGNSANNGGGMSNHAGSNPQIHNTIFWGNTAVSEAQLYNDSSAPVVSDSIVEGGYSDGTNIITADPMLGAPGNYGGITETFPLLPGSSAIDTAGDNCPDADQRGVTRPQGASCDIGAYEAKFLTVTANDKTISYGDAEPAYDFTADPPDAMFSAAPDCGVSGAHANVGTYTVSCASGAAIDDTYMIVYVTGTLTINKATAPITLGNLTSTYDGTIKSATAVTNPPGLTVNFTYDGLPNAPTNAGSYAVIGTVNDPNYIGAGSGTLVINKADPPVALSVTNSPLIYDNTPKVATVVSSGASGSVSNIKYNGSSTAPTNAGTYTITLDFTPTDTVNYNILTGFSAGDFIINKTNPTATLAVNNSPVVYNGSAQFATVGITTSSVPGSVGNILIEGAASKTNAGTYPVTATFIPDDTTNYNTLTGLSAGDFVINKITPTAALAVNNSPAEYNGSARFATAGVTTSSVPGSVSNILTGGAASKINVGTYPVTASFIPDDTTNYNSVTGLPAGDFIINKGTPTVTLAVNNSLVEYNGSAQFATVEITASSVPGSVGNILTGGAASQINMGTYPVTADFVPDDTNNYNTVTGLSAGNFVISKITPTVTLAVNNPPVIYNGSAQFATVGITSSSVPGSISNVLIGGAPSKINAGTYPVTASFIPDDTTNYNIVTGLSAGNFVINKANPTAALAVNNSPVGYNGSAQFATIGITTSSVPGSVGNILIGGAASKTNAGAYPVTASFIPDDTTNYNTLTGLSAGNFVVNKATPTVTLAVNNSPVEYNASAQFATVGITTSSVIGSISNILTGGAASQINMGTYPVTADFVPDDTANYNAVTGLPAGNFVISKITPTVTLAVNNSPVVYNGSAQFAMVGITTSSVPGSVGNILIGGAASKTNAGTYPVTASFIPDDTTNYNIVTGLPAGNFIINKANPTAALTVNNSPVVYNGSAQFATVGIATSSVPGSVVNVLTGGAASKTNAGAYPVTADFVPDDMTNYNTIIGLPAGNFTINKITPTVTLAVNNSPVEYNGSARFATVGVTTSSVPGSVGNILIGGAASKINAGTYPVTATFIPDDTANYNTVTGLAAGNFVINKANPTVTLAVNNSPVVYNGLAQFATVGITTSSVPGSVNNILIAGAASKTNAGAYPATANFIPNDTTNYNTLTGLSAGNFVINKANPTAALAVSNSPVVYNGSSRFATVGITNSSIPGSVGNILIGGAVSEINAGTYAATADFIPNDTDNYNILTGLAAGNFIINKITPTLSASSTPLAYDGLPHTADVGSSVPGSIGNILVGGLASQTNADTYPVTADFIPTDTTNYAALTGAFAGNFVINSATPTATLVVSNPSILFDGAPHAALVGIKTSSVPGSVINVITGGAAAQTALGTYAVTADFVPDDTANYSALIGISAGNFTINPFRSTAADDGWTLEAKEINTSGILRGEYLFYVIWQHLTRSPSKYEDMFVVTPRSLKKPDFSNVTGASNNTGSLRVGDNALRMQYRSILHFDTASLPNNAVVTKTTLLIKQESVTGTPFATLGSLIADIKKGSFGRAALELGDFKAPAAPIRPESGFVATGSAYQLELSSDYFQYINLTGATQFRLRFTRDDDNDNAADFISFFSGDALNVADRPQLIIEYYVP